MQSATAVMAELSSSTTSANGGTSTRFNQLAEHSFALVGGAQPGERICAPGRDGP